MADMKRWDGTSGYPILDLNKYSEVTPTSQSAAFGLELTGGDYKTLILMENKGAADATVTFAKGNGIQGVGGNLVVTVEDGTVGAIVLDSGYFKNVSGTAKDMVTITPSAAIYFTIIELPQ